MGFRELNVILNEDIFRILELSALEQDSTIQDVAESVLVSFAKKSGRLASK
ncbi:MAG: hypothetical protein ACYDAJ_02560 [Nitrosotalea sp.]